MKKVVLLGAAGRDFHNFNMVFRDNSRYRVVAFTASQIPRIEGRLYPPELAGDLYPEGIPILSEEELPRIISRHGVDLVVFCYSDVSHEEVMHKASLVMAEGAHFLLLGAHRTMLESSKPVVSVCAVRTGCGKSPATRRVCAILERRSLKPVVVRHPMPYGDLVRQAVQRFSTWEDFRTHQCTLEEREEYEPLVDMGVTVFAGVDYGRVLKQAEEEGDVIIWDGGNNDTPFFRPQVHVVLFDPHRAGHERLYTPGETNMLMADVAVISKMDTASAENVERVLRNILQHAPRADIVLAASPVTVEDPEAIRGKRVLVVEDGPTLTHGDMSFGAGTLAARKYGASELVDPHPFAVGSMKETLRRYPHIELQLPATGYSDQQIEDLRQTIEATPCDLVLMGTPSHLNRLLSLEKPSMAVNYRYEDYGEPTLEQVLVRRLEGLGILSTETS